MPTEDEDLTPETEPKFALVPPNRPPPTVVGAGTPGSPEFHRQPARSHRSAVLRFLAESTTEYVGMLATGVARVLRMGRWQGMHNASRP